MRLKHIKLAGFKSFVDATTVPFPDQMTAIVGPNGCGKSNVIDAVRWVLGESSAKNLRGDAMTDVIFNGSSNRKPVSQASVELVFDNSQGRLEGNLADRIEISVKRQVNKDGQSSYFLNGSKCRRRDITDIFLGTGLGPRSYAIIEQGMISRLIESKPQELRVFIEEAAGISKYKERRRETENRIRHTRDNLERLEDVCQELGTQLEKLKRQASTARRYKELKANERKFKAELYALKWLKYNEQYNLYEKERLEKEVELESFVSQQRGGELGLIKLKQTQTAINDKVQEAQKQSFAVSNQITRLEQQILFADETLRRQKDEAEHLNQQIQEANSHIEIEREQLEQIALDIEANLPRQELIAEEYEVASEQLLLLEQEYDEWQMAWERQQNVAASSRQSAQVIQTKIQGLESQVNRMQQRITDLNREVVDLAEDRLLQQIEPLREAGELQAVEVVAAAERLTAAEFTKTQASATFDQARQEHEQRLRECQSIEAKLDSLKYVQQQFDKQILAGSDELKETHGIETFGSLLAQLNVESKWQSAVEALLSHFGQPLLVDRLPEEHVSGQFVLAESVDAEPGSIAEKVQQGFFPAWFNRVAALQDGIRFEQTSAHFFSAISPSGQWQGDNWSSFGGLSAGDNQFVLERLAQIKRLSTEQEKASERLTTSQRALQAAESGLANANNDSASAQRELDAIERSRQDNQLELKLLEQQHQQNQTLIKKLQVESDSLSQQIEMEQEHIFALEQERDLTQEQQVDVEEALMALDNQKSALLQQVSNAKHQVEEIKNRRHQMELRAQAERNKHASIQQNLNRAMSHLQQMETKWQTLNQQLGGAQEPTAELQAELEQQLILKVEAEEALSVLHLELAKVTEEISELEQGQSGVLAKLDKMRSDIAAVKLDSEGARVRAQNMLETLNELEQPIKPILENMPSDAEENAWAEKLEKTTASIGRLGAINLTAIEEYDLQSERKEYLDTQYQDLVSALETLESAIRKIDRESRAKFKQTYEQVNGDLQHLFPKVFGGGAAYLELTGDDLLETGVTIMARPPGKKNSTIHLLSGGEKALTALSLVFSIFRLNPAPFCMLDEVDAPLDDANVGRFCNLVKEMSESVQFIYISHNKVAMEMATHLTGVTMQEPGVSRLVAVDIQEAVKMAEAS